MNTESRDERLREIRRRHAMVERWVGDYSPSSVIDFLLSLLDNETPRPTGWQTAQVAFDNPRMVKVVFETPECAEAFIDGVEPADGPIVAATRMRDACVEKVRAMRKDWQTEAEARRDPDNPHDYKGSYGLASGAVDACDDIITAISSLTLDQVEKKQ